MISDTEVFTALLASTNEADVPVRALRRGCEIAQLFFESGYSFAERIGTLGRNPTLVHAMGRLKLWLTARDRRPWERLQQAWSVYARVAGSFASEMDEPMDWARTPRRAALAGHASSPGRLTVCGWPAALADEIARRGVRLAQRLRSFDRFQIDPDTVVANDPLQPLAATA